MCVGGKHSPIPVTPAAAANIKWVGAVLPADGVFVFFCTVPRSVLLGSPGARRDICDIRAQHKRVGRNLCLFFGAHPQLLLEVR